MFTSKEWMLIEDALDAYVSIPLICLRATLAEGNYSSEDISILLDETMETQRDRMDRVGELLDKIASLRGTHEDERQKTISVGALLQLFETALTEEIERSKNQKEEKS